MSMTGGCYCKQIRYEINGLPADADNPHYPVYTGSGSIAFPQVNLITVPEPSTALFLGMGLALLRLRGRLSELE